MQGSPVFPRAGSGRAAPGTYGMKHGQAVAVGSGSSEVYLPQPGGCIYPRSLWPPPGGMAMAGKWSGLPVSEERRSAL